MKDKNTRVEESTIQWVLNRYKAISSPSLNIPVIGVAGVSNTGKTKVMAYLVNRLSHLGYSVGTIKHDGHGYEIDYPEKDSYIHRKAGAQSVSIVSSKMCTTIRKTENQERPLSDVILDHLERDVILVEGYKHSSIPKFEVVRSIKSTESVCEEATLLGRITDVEFANDLIPSFQMEKLDCVLEVIENIIKAVTND